MDERVKDIEYDDDFAEEAEDEDSQDADETSTDEETVNKEKHKAPAHKAHKSQAHHATHKDHPDHQGTHRKPKKTTWFWIIGLILIIIAAGAVYFTMRGGNGGTSGDTTGGTTGGTSGATLADGGKQITMEEFSDFQCPVCKSAFPTVEKVRQLYGDKIIFTYKHFPLSSIHQNAQVAAEASECARDQGKFEQYYEILFTKGNGDGTGLDKDSLKKYAKDLGLDTAKFNTCVDSGSKASVVKAQQDDGTARGVTGTPGFFIDGKFFNGLMPLESFIQAIDEARGVDSGILDELLKDEPKVQITVLSDAACGAECDTSRLLPILKQLFPKNEIKELEVASDEGKALVEKYGLERMPAYLLSTNIVDTAKYKENQNLQTAFEKKDDAYHIIDAATGAKAYIDPVKRAEVAKQKADKLGLTDKPQADLFVMSYCPYGNIAEEAMEKAYKVLGDKAVFRVHYVVYSDYSGRGGTKEQFCIDKDYKYCSMHGTQEVNQNVREMCVYRDLGLGKMFEFMLAMNKDCTAQNADTCWQGVAKKLSLDADAISACEKDDGYALLAKEKELNTLLDVGGSPFAFIDGEPFANDRDPQGYISALCAKFGTDKPAECDGVAEPVTTADPTGGAGCGV